MAPGAPKNPEAKQEIKVVPQPVENAPPPKPGSARERMSKDLQKFAKPGTFDPAAGEEQPATPATPPKTDDPAKPADAAPPADPNAQPPAGAPKPAEGTDKKESPWKLVDRYKGRVADLEKQLSEKTALPEAERTGYLDRIKAAEERNKELESEIRFVNYKKSDEFKQKYEAPYQRAWQTAMSELGELRVADGNGGERPMKFDDILQLVNLPLPEAKELAKQKFGEFEGDVMAHRKAIRQLWDAQAAALEDALKQGEAREKAAVEKRQHETQTVQKFVSETWTSTNEAAMKDEKYGKHFSPIDGDEDGNARLKKGFELVDQAFRENPMAPGLTEEQRKAIVKRHSAVRNRAAAFGRLVSQLSKKEARIAELEKQLAEINGSVPPTGGERPSSAGAQPSSAKDALKAGLQKYAKTV